MTAETIEIVFDGKSHFVDVEQAERELGIAHGDSKEITTDDLVLDGSTKELPTFIIRPFQTLKIKAVGGNLSCPGSVGGGRLLKGTVLPDGSEAHFSPDEWCKNVQGHGNSWITLTDSDGQHSKLRFGFGITKN